jgi:branched-chain amino acid transport system substrate-binding protein
MTHTPGTSVAALLALTGFVACSSIETPVPQKSSIKIASAIDVTGGTIDSLAPTWENAAALAVEQVNAAGGIQGHPLEMIRYDSESMGDIAVTRLQAGHATHKYVAVITGISTVSTSVANGFAATHDVLQICNGCTTPNLTTAHGNGWLYRTSPNSDLQGPILAKHLYVTLGFRKVGIIHCEDPFGTGLAKGFADAFVALGGSVTKQLSHPQAVKSTYTGDVTTVIDTAPDAIFVATYVNNSVKVAQDWDLAGYRTPLFFPHPARAQALLDDLPEEAQRFLGGTSNAMFDGPEGVKFRDAYKARFPDSDLTLFTAGVYDATMVIALALEAAGKEAPVGADVRAALPRIQTPGAEKVGTNDFALAKQLLAAGQPIDYVGASGPVDFDTERSAHTRYAIWKIEQRQFVDITLSELP